MKRTAFVLTLLLAASLACNLGSAIRQAGQSPESGSSGPGIGTPCVGAGCGDDQVAQGIGEELEETEGGIGPISPADEGSVVLYNLAENAVLAMEIPGFECSTMGFLRFEGAGVVWPESGQERALPVRDYMVSPVTATTLDRYFYISAPEQPVKDYMGMPVPDWDAPGQTLWGAAFAGGDAEVIAAPSEAGFPGDVAVSPDGRFLLYPLTDLGRSSGPDTTGGLLEGKFNPFLSDSSLVVLDLSNGEKRTLLEGRYNRQLFRSLGDFSATGDVFFTLAREPQGFRLLEIDLNSGAVVDFEERHPEFPWDSLDWDSFFPTGMDTNYAQFSISPEEARIVAVKDVLVGDMSNPCSPAGSYRLWLFDFESNLLQTYEDLPGSVTDLAWRPDGSAFALAVQDRGGCYPEYLDAQIDLRDRDASRLETMVSEPQSKIVGIAWSSDGSRLAYDVYGADLIGRLKIVDSATGEVQELIDTAQLGIPVDRDRPVTLLLSGWVKPAD